MARRREGMEEGALWGEGWWFIVGGGRGVRGSRGPVLGSAEEVPVPSACAQRPRHAVMDGWARRGPLA